MKKLLLILSIFLTNILSAQDSSSYRQDTTGNTYITNNYYNNDYSYADNLRLFYGEDYWYYSMFTPVVNWYYSPYYFSWNSWYWGYNYGWYWGYNPYWNCNNYWSWNWNNYCNYGHGYRNYTCNNTSTFYGPRCSIAPKHLLVTHSLYTGARIQRTSYPIRNNQQQYTRINTQTRNNYNQYNHVQNYRNTYRPSTNYTNFGYHGTVNYSRPSVNNNFRSNIRSNYSAPSHASYGGGGHFGRR